MRRRDLGVTAAAAAAAALDGDRAKVRQKVEPQARTAEGNAATRSIIAGDDVSGSIVAWHGYSPILPPSSSLADGERPHAGSAVLIMRE